MKIHYSYLTGRCRTGSDRQGVLVHAIAEEDNFLPYFGKALCGVRPGRLSGGWSDNWQETATCPKCLDRLRRRAEVVI